MQVERLIDFAQRLVRTPGFSGQEQTVAGLVAAEMREVGFDDVRLDENGAVVGVIDGARPGPTLLLDAHCDTVGIAPGSTWARDPFGGGIIDGYLCGRGSADMKGALAAMVYAAAGLDRAALAGRAAVSATVMEEVIEGLSLKAVMDRLRPDFVVIGEATQLNLNHGGRGRAEVHLETLGRPAHSSSPQLGVNAVHQMRKVIDVVERLPLPEHPLMGPALFALTDIISDPYPAYSVTPSRCRVTYDRRLLPGETPEAVLGAINSHADLREVGLQARIAQAEHTAYTGVVLRAEKFFPAWSLGPDHPFVQKSLGGLKSAGLAPELGAYQFCTNAAYSAGVAGVPTIGFGPGAEGDAHVVDERLAIGALLDAARGYAGIITAALSG